MMNTFEIGENVSLLNETGSFIVRKILGKKVLVEDEFGFDQLIDLDLLVKKRPIKVDKIIVKDFSILGVTKKRSSTNTFPEIDLHLENLISDDSKMSAHEKFIFQINRFKQFTNEMIRRKVSKFRVIHGRGEGKLKTEINFLIESRVGFIMHDDNYFQGKVGASIIEMQITKVSPFEF